MNVLVSAVALVLAAAASGTVKVPATSTSEIVTDGRIFGTEWSDATRVSLGGGVALYIKANDDQIAIAVKNAARGPQYTDLYLAAADGQIWNLHAEKETSERKLIGASWTDADPAFVPYNNANWLANVIEFRHNADPTQPLAKQVKPYDGQEFLISRSQFSGKEWRLRVEVHDLAQEKPDLVYPADSDGHDAATWATIALP
ncbi:MAG: hypothetical protein GC190_16315 [Alphaproteobacteria bacterium]|nr:hypothetical protein [Alphaproteobacteria bacterium]